MRTKPKIRVLVADDSALMRRTLRRLIEADPDLEVLDTARDGEDAVVKARTLRPDVVSMDINMPKLDGISALQLIVHEAICPVVMLSSLTQRGAVATFESMELGAFDFVAKPSGTVSSDLGTVGRELCSKLKAAVASHSFTRLGRRRARGMAALARERAADRRGPRDEADSPPASADLMAIAIGISTGGPATIGEVLPLLPRDLNAAVFLVQHMPGTFTASFAQRLDDTCQLRVEEAAAGTEVRPGHCYVGRGDYHLTVHRSTLGRRLIRTSTKPDTLFKPSVDVMMESVLAAFGGERTIGVLMTGIGDDGADMMVKIKQAGGYTIAESEETAVVFGMPREAIARGGAHAVLPSWDIAKAILRRF